MVRAGQMYKRKKRSIWGDNDIRFLVTKVEGETIFFKYGTKERIDFTREPNQYKGFKGWLDELVLDKSQSILTKKVRLG